MISAPYSIFFSYRETSILLLLQRVTNEEARDASERADYIIKKCDNSNNYSQQKQGGFLLLADRARREFKPFVYVSASATACQGARILRNAGQYATDEPVGYTTMYKNVKKKLLEIFLKKENCTKNIGLGNNLLSWRSQIVFVGFFLISF